MTTRHFKHETWLYALAFFFALSLRLIQLGATPLTDIEAAPALQALHIAQGLKSALSPHPFYILSTSILFFIYGGGTNFLARFIPALIGSILVFVPLLFTERIKPRPSLILAFFIALDPGMVAISRQAASPIFAITFLLFAWGFFYKNKPNLTGIFAALALLSGPSIWLGILGLAITWAIFQGIQSRLSANYQRPTFNFHPSSFLITFILAGTLFFIVPNGLSAALASIPEFINRWTTLSDFSIAHLLFSLIIYQPLGILLTLFAILRGVQVQSPRIIFLSIWFLIALLLAVFIPSRQINDLAWALIPLWAISALEFPRNLNIFPEERKEIYGVISLLIFIWVFAWLDFAGMVWIQPNTREYIMRFWLLIGSLLLMALSLLLVAMGWSLRTAQIGGILGLTITLGVLGFSGTLGSAGLRGTDHPELWQLSSIPAQAEFLQVSVNQLSNSGLGNDNAASVVIAGINSPALEWVLREHQTIVVKTLDESSTPYFVITPLQDNPILASAYRGQDFNWKQTPAWNIALPQEWIRWITSRTIPQSGSNESIILWARDDLFLDSVTKSNP